MSEGNASLLKERISIERYKRIGPRAHEKDVLRNLHMVSFGVRIPGDLVRLQPPCGNTMSLIYFVLLQRVVPRKHRHIVLARWVRVWELNCSSFGTFECAGGWPTRSSSVGPLPRDVFASSPFLAFWLLSAAST